MVKCGSLSACVRCAETGRRFARCPPAQPLPQGAGRPRRDRVSSNEPHTRSLGPGRTVDTGDQLSSVVLLGLAIAGGLAAVLLNAIL